MADTIRLPKRATARRKRMTTASVLCAVAGQACSVALLFTVVLIGTSYPADVDRPPSPQEIVEMRHFYAKAYARGEAEAPADERYVTLAERAAKADRVEEKVRSFVDQFGLQRRRILDVGAGRGYLQDIVEDYTGLDIAASASRFFHKPFVLGSATAMPFANNEFDAVWSIWVLEHVPNPEQALREMRRVLKDGGLLYLYPAWNCKWWAAEGYDQRPYSDFSLVGKLRKASIPFSIAWSAFSQTPVRLLRYACVRSAKESSVLHYTRLSPNYQKYWQADSDAVNSLDRYETALWFLSRGDLCLTCDGSFSGLFSDEGPLVIRIRKR